MNYAIVVTYNGANWIAKCLHSLLEGDVSLNILVVDNNSTDGTVGKITRSFGSVDIIRMQENTGFGRAANIGLERAYCKGAEYLFLLNQDAWVMPDTVGELILVSQRNSMYGIISPLHCDGSGDCLDFRFSRYLEPAKCPGLYSDALLQRPLGSIYEVGFVNAAAWLLPRATVELVGGFDPVFFHYGEDENYVQRVKYQGKKVGVCPHVRIFHDRETRFASLERRNNARLNAALVEYCDVNKNGPELLCQRRATLKRRLWKQRLTGFRNSNGISEELRLLTEIQERVRVSWNMNLVIGLNHLQVEDLGGSEQQGG